MVDLLRAAIVGAGQIGSRHLQSFARLDRPFQLVVIDPDERSLAAAKIRFEEAEASAANRHPFRCIVYATGFDILDSLAQLDVAIVATHASVRLQVLKELIRRLAIRHIICEKVLFQDLDSYQKAAQWFSERNIQVWVNCPFRTLNFFRTLKKDARSSMWEYSVYGSGINLASNAVHHLDLFTYLTGTPLERVRSDFLHRRIQKSKHSGCIEFTGTLLAESAHHRFEMTSFPCPGHPLVIRLMTEDGTWFIELLAERAVHLSADGERTVPFSFPPQSERTHLLVKELLDTGTCGLPTFHESRHVHERLLNAFMDRLESVTGRRPAVCPIT